MVFGRLLRGLDTISPTPSFNVSGKDRIQSLSGGFFVILSFMTLLAYAIYAVWDYMQYNLVSATELPFTTKISPAVDLKANRLLPMIALLDRSQGDYVNPSKYRDFLQFEFMIDSLEANDTSASYFNKSVEFVPCIELSDSERSQMFGEFTGIDDEAELFLNYSLCLRPKSPTMSMTIQGMIHRLKSTTASLIVYPCDVSNKECSNRDETEAMNMVDNLKLVIGFVVPVIDVNDFESPISYTLDFDRYYFLKNAAKTVVDISLTHKFITNDLGPLFSQNKKLSIVNFGDEKERSASRGLGGFKCDFENDFGNCNQLIQVNIYSSLSASHIIRKYKGIAEVLGTVGGNKEIIILIFAMLFKILYGRQQKLEIVKYVFGIEAEKRRCCKKKKTGDIYKIKVEEVKNKKLNQKKNKEDIKLPQINSKIVVSDSVIDSAFKSIENSLDVFELVKELNKLKFFFSHIMMNEKHPIWQLCYMNQILNPNRDSSNDNSKLKYHPDAPTLDSPTPSKHLHQRDASAHHPLNESLQSRLEDDRSATRKSSFTHTAKQNIFKDYHIEPSDCRPPVTRHAVNGIDTDTSDIARVIQSRMTQAAVDTMAVGRLRPWSLADLKLMFNALDEEPAGHCDFDEDVRVRKIPVNENIGVV